jgi:hypothetical protein
MKKMTWMRGALALTVMLAASPALAADHLDSPAVKADPAADIADLYTWVSGSDTILVLDTYPSATTSTTFSDAVQYVFHTSSTTAYGATASTPLNIIATFNSTGKISVWVGTADYVTGDASSPTGLTSASGDTKVFAGLRDDPFFFNLAGFHAAEAFVEANASGLTFNAAGCPALPAAAVSALVGDLEGNATSPAVDFFAPGAGYSGNVLAIVLSVKTSILTAGGPILAVWASTNTGA